MDFLLIVFLTLLNAAFAMSELALTASRKTRLLTLAEMGDPGAKAALNLLEEPTRFLSTVQVGITSIGVLNGIIGEAAFSQRVSSLLQAAGVTTSVADISATAVVVTLITCVTIIFGELVPKRIGQLYPERVARWVAIPMSSLALMTAPLVKFLSVSTQAVLRLLRIDTAQGQSVTEEEIRASLAEGLSAGLIEAHEHQMVHNVFRLDDRKLASLMTPRSQLVWLDAGLSVSECLQQVQNQGGKGGHSRYPVCRGGLDHVLGTISVAHLLAVQATSPEVAASPVALHAQTAEFVPETLSGLELLQQLKMRDGSQGSGMLFVVDEYGVVQGLLTAFDLLEAITGELQASEPSQAWATPQADGSWLLLGPMPIAELKSRLGLLTLPGEERELFNTLGGLLMSLAGRIPQVAECFFCEGWTFRVLQMDGRRVAQVSALKA